MKTSRIQIVTLNFKAMSLSFVIININIVIIGMHLCSMSQIYQYECKVLYVSAKSLNSLKTNKKLSEKAVSFVITLHPK